MTLKINLHMHTKEDPVDRIFYTIYEIVDYAKRLGFDVLAFTPHRKFVCKKEHIDYAAGKGILLIPGIEAKLEGKDVVVLNCDESINEVKTLGELREYRKKNLHIFVIAPHPFVLSSKSLGKKLEENIDIFDAVELSVFSNKIFNFNKKAIEVAKKYDKPIVATSDTHFLKDLSRGYILANTEKKTASAVFDVIRKKKFENKLNPMGLCSMVGFSVKASLRLLYLPPADN